MITVYRNLLSGLEKVLKFLTSILFALMVIVACIEVFRRYVLGLSFIWADELVRFMMIWMTFLGGALGYRKKDLVNFDFVQNALPAKMKPVGQFVITIVGMIFAALIVYIGITFTFSDSVTGQESMCMRIPMSIMYFSIPVGLGAMVLFMIDDIIAFLRKEWKGDAV